MKSGLFFSSQPRALKFYEKNTYYFEWEEKNTPRLLELFVEMLMKNIIIITNKKYIYILIVEKKMRAQMRGVTFYGRYFFRLFILKVDRKYSLFFIACDSGVSVGNGEKNLNRAFMDIWKWYNSENFRESRAARWGWIHKFKENGLFSSTLFIQIFNEMEVWSLRIKLFYQHLKSSLSCLTLNQLNFSSILNLTFLK